MRIPSCPLARTLLVCLALVLVLTLSLSATTSATPSPQQAIPHGIADHADCVSCHATGTNGAPQYPANHQGRTNDTCTTCHQAAAAPAASSSVPAATQPAAAPSGALSLDAWSAKACQSCHPKEWAEWSRSGHAMTLSAQLLNADHNAAEQLDQTCVKCHSPELGTTPIGNIVQPLDTKGPWHLTGAYANAGDTPAISCLGCHQSHSAATTGLLAGMDFADEASFYRDVPAPEVANLYIYDALAQKHVAPQAIAPVMNGDQPIPISDTRANRVCYTCHASERAESNLFEPATPAAGDNSVSTGDDRTLMGVHQGLQCVDCHMPAGSHTFNPMASCSQCHSAATAASLSYVTTAHTSYTDPALSMLSGNQSTLNIHWLDKAQVWPPVAVSMTAADGGDSVVYSITLTNNGAADISEIDVKSTIPAGTTYLDSWVINRNNPGKFAGGDVSLAVSSVGAGQTYGPLVYRVAKGSATDFTTHAWVQWQQPVPGSALSPNVTIAK